MIAQYVHTLLFHCPNCGQAMAVSHVSDEKNLETVDAQSFRVGCRSCHQSFVLPALQAKSHSVREWSLGAGA